MGDGRVRSGPAGLSIRDRLGVKVSSARLLLLATNMDDISGDIVGKLSPPKGTSLMQRFVSDTSPSSCLSSACSLQGRTDPCHHLWSSFSITSRRPICKPVERPNKRATLGSLRYQPCRWLS